MNTMWLSQVHPRLETIMTNSLDWWYQPTAMAFATRPFAYWRGTITFRFEIVASSFHRGKIAVFYEPNLSQASIINAGLSTNKQFLKIVDIQETQTFEVDVEWARPRAWAAAPAAASTTYYGTTIAVTAPTEKNGYIGVVPFTRLQSPDTSDVAINVYVYSKDMMVNFLTADLLPTMRKVRTESGVMTTDEIKSDSLNDASSVPDDACLYHFGERPLSFRSLLKRYVQTNTYSFVDNASATIRGLNLTAPIFPNNCLIVGATSVTGSWNLFSYLRYSYVGIRGSVRKRTRFVGTYNVSSTSQERVSLLPAAVPAATTGAASSVTWPNALEGTVVFVPASNGGIEFELPYYSNNLFAICFSDDYRGDMNTDEYIPRWPQSYRIVKEVNGAYTNAYYVEDSAAGEDFCLLRYQGAPFYTET
jgi:hypothetical protein